MLAIRCKNLRKSYGDVVAVDGLDLEVKAGECFGLLGPNGAGKTTTMEILEGLLAPTSGDIEVLEQRWGQADYELRNRIGISLQETRLSEKQTVYETLRLFRSFYDSGHDPDDVIQWVGLEEKRDSYVGKLSGGQRQRLAVACALVGNPSLVFLDEPTTGMDPQSRRQLWSILRKMREGGRTFLITTHYMDEAEKLCDRVGIVDRGKMIAVGSPEELRAQIEGEHVVEFGVERVGGGQVESPLEESVLSALPGVLRVNTSDERIYLNVSEPHVTLPSLLEALHARDLALNRLTTRHASLEDVFVRLTGRSLSEDDEEVLSC